MGPPVILMRASLAEEAELAECKKYFPTIQDRARVANFVSTVASDVSLASKCPLVIPRYSVLPYPQELENDVKILGGTLINTTRQHRYVADLQQWYVDFEGVTPKTWFRAEDVPIRHAGSFVLKGATNSRKHKWNSHMFAADRSSISDVLVRLYDDPLISEQGVYVREFEPFVTYDLSINGLPVTNERRFFILDGHVLCDGFYWSDSDVIGQPSTDATRFVEHEVIPRLMTATYAPRFVVADVAEHIDGRWRLVELNDGCMSGLSSISADTLYYQLARHLKCLARRLPV